MTEKQLKQRMIGALIVSLLLAFVLLLIVFNQ